MRKRIALGAVLSVAMFMSLVLPDMSKAQWWRVDKHVERGANVVADEAKKKARQVKEAAEAAAREAKRAAEAAARETKRAAEKAAAEAKKAAEAAAKAAKQAAEKAAKLAKKGYEGAKKAAGSAYSFAMKNCGRIPEPGKTACKAQVRLIKRQVDTAHSAARVGGKFVEWQAKQAKGAITNPEKYFKNKFDIAVAAGLGMTNCVRGPEKCAKDALELAKKVVKLVQVGKPVEIRGCTKDRVKTGFSYCKEVTVNMKACASVWGEKICRGPGKMKTKFKGQAGLVTFVNQDSSEIGATVDVRQTLRFNFFGKNLPEVGLSCQFTKGAKTRWSHVFGVNYKVPAIPSISTNTILDAAMSRRLRKDGKKSSRTGIHRKKSNKKAKSGFAGKVTKKEWYKLAKGGGCAIVPNIMLFKGMPAINLANAGIKITAGVRNWRVKKNRVSAEFFVNASASGKILGDPVKVAGVSVKIPGFGWSKNIGDLAKKGFGVNVPLGDLLPARGPKPGAVASTSGPRPIPGVVASTSGPRPGKIQDKVRKNITRSCTKRFKRNKRKAKACVKRRIKQRANLMRVARACTKKFKKNRKKVSKCIGDKMRAKRIARACTKKFKKNRKKVKKCITNKRKANRIARGGIERCNKKFKKNRKKLRKCIQTVKRSKRPRRRPRRLGKAYAFKGLGGKCLDVAGNKNKNGANIILWKCHGGRNQQWKPGPKKTIVGLGGKCLDVAGNRNKNGANIILWKCHRKANQQWRAVASRKSKKGRRPRANRVKWVTWKGKLPAYAVIGGKEPGRKLPVCRASYKKGMHPGKVVAGKCNIGWGGKEIVLRRFQVMTAKGIKIVWVRGPRAKGMLIGGREPGRRLPICRASFKGGVHPGKVVAGKCNIGWGGKERVLRKFEVATAKKGRRPTN